MGALAGPVGRYSAAVAAFYDPGAALARVQQEIEAARERAEKAAAARAAIAPVRGRGRSPRRGTPARRSSPILLRDIG